jgi:hypothetical protein
LSADHTVIDLDFYSTVEELKEVGPEKLKEVSHIIFSGCFVFPSNTLCLHGNLKS